MTGPAEWPALCRKHPGTSLWQIWSWTFPAHGSGSPLFPSSHTLRGNSPRPSLPCPRKSSLKAGCIVQESPERPTACQDASGIATDRSAPSFRHSRFRISMHIRWPACKFSRPACRAPTYSKDAPVGCNRWPKT